MSVSKHWTWRVGRSLGRTLYIGDNVIGIVDNADQAAMIVHAVNTWQAAGPHHEHLWQKRSSFGEDWEVCLGCRVQRNVA